MAAVQATAPRGGRSSPPLHMEMEDVLNVEHKLEVAWLEMNEAAAELQTKLHEMLKWQRTQLESTSTRLASAHKKLGKLRPEMVKQSWFGAPEPTRAPPPATPEGEVVATRGSDTMSLVVKVFDKAARVWPMQQPDDVFSSGMGIVELTCTCRVCLDDVLVGTTAPCSPVEMATL